MMPAGMNFCNVCGCALDGEADAGRCAACLVAGAMTLSGADVIGELGGHELTEELARGGMGVVYRARQISTGREVALKAVLGSWLSSSEARERFRQEARAMAALEHASILPVYQFGDEDGVPFFTMKLADGGTLAQRLAEYAGQWRRIAELVATIADAVQFAHERGVLHRDLKPGNILFDQGGHAYVSDFGLAKLADSQDDLTRSEALMGTLHYMAPEVAAHAGHAATTVSDVWSLGIILYELLAQKRPFEGESAPVILRAITEQNPSSPAQAPRDLSVMALKALAREPSRRYASAADLAQDLRRWLNGQPIAARPVSAGEKLILWARRSPVLAAMSALVLLALLTTIATLTWSLQHSREDAARIRAAQSDTQQQLRSALLAKARSGRIVRVAGWRESGLQALRQVVHIRNGDDVRDEAIAHLAGFDMSIVSEPVIPQVAWPESPSVSLPRSFDVFASLVQQDRMALYRVSDGTQTGIFPSLEKAAHRRLTYDPAGRWIAVNDDDGKARRLSLFDSQTMKQHGNWPDCVMGGFNEDGSRFALIEQRQRLRIIQTADGSDTGTMPRRPFEPELTTIASDPGLRMAAVSVPGSMNAGIEVWDYANGKVAAAFPYDGITTSMAWQGDWLAAGSQQGNARLFNLRTHLDSVLSGQVNIIWHQAFTPDGKFLATCSFDGTSTLWQCDSGQLLVRAPNIFPRVFATDGRRFLEGGRGGFHWGQVTHPASLRIISDRLMGWGLKRMDISPDGRWFTLTRRHASAVYETATGRLLATVPLNDGSVALFASDGRHFIISKSSGISLARLEVKDGHLGILVERDLCPPGGKLFYPATLSQNRRWMATISQNTNECLVMDCTDYGSWANYKSELPGLIYAEVSPDGQWIIAFSSKGDGRYALWNRAEPDKPRRLNVGKCEIRFSPDGRWLAEGNAQSGLLIYDTTTWQIIHKESMPNPGDLPPILAWSPDSRLLAFSIERQRIQLLKTGSWSRTGELASPLEHLLGVLNFSPDGRTLITNRNNGGVELWDLTRLSAELSALGIPWPLAPPCANAPTPPDLAVPLKDAVLPALFSEAEK